MDMGLCSANGSNYETCVLPLPIWSEGPLSRVRIRTWLTLQVEDRKGCGAQEREPLPVHHGSGAVSSSGSFAVHRKVLHCTLDVAPCNHCLWRKAHLVLWTIVILLRI